MKLRVLVPLFVVCLANAAMAQRGGGRRDDMGASRRQEDEPALTVQEPLNPVDLLIQHWTDLKLTPEQIGQLRTIKRSLDSTNAPAHRTLDSLQRAMRPSGMLGQLKPEQRDSIPVARARAARLVDELQENMRPMRERAFGVLTPEQAGKAESIETDAQRARDAAAAAREAARGKP